jgi:hypothetical protein
VILKSATIKNLESIVAARIGPRPRYPDQPALEPIKTGIAEVDSMVEGFRRGTITEIIGPVSSGKTGLLLSALARATKLQESCALIDAYDVFDPASAFAAGVGLDQLLWVRCGGDVEKALKATDLLLQAGGFGFVSLDLGDVSPRDARRIPSSYWFRFRRSVENTSTAVAVVVSEPCARSCAALALELSMEQANWLGEDSLGLLNGFRIKVTRRRPAGSGPNETFFELVLPRER